MPLEAPSILNLHDDHVNFKLGFGAVALDASSTQVDNRVLSSVAATVTDGDSADFDGGALTVTIVSGEIAAEDLLTLDTSGTVSLSGSTAGSNVLVDGTVVGTLGNDIGVGNDLVINFNANANPTTATTLVQALQYDNTNATDPDTDPRTIRVTISDGDGSTSANADVELRVTTPATGSFVDTNQALGSSNSDAIAFGDVDGDGDLDALVGNNGIDRLWLNDGSGTFTDSGQAIGPYEGTEQVALVDIDGDGDLDAVTGGDSIKVYTNNGSGTFTEVTSIAGHNAWDMGVGDLNGDGNVDLMLGNFGAANTVWFGNGAGGFSNSGQSLGSNDTRSLELADLDGDGDLDALEIVKDSGAYLWINDGSGTFSGGSLAIAHTDPRCVALGDVDGDGDIDVFISDWDTPNQVWLNDGSGSFTDSGQTIGGVETYEVALEDIDGDGDLDAIVTSYNTNTKVYFNDGSGTYTDSGQTLISAYGQGLAVGDLDNDGDLDIMIGNYSSVANDVFLNNNDPVLVNLHGDALAYTEGDGAQVIEEGGDAAVSDSDSTDFDLGTLTVSISAGLDNAEDLLAIRNQGTGAGQIGVSGLDVTYEGTVIGTFVGGAGGTDLIVTFNSSVTAAASSALIRNITFENVDTVAPTEGPRTIDFTLTDGDGGSTGTHSATVTVSGINSTPVIANLDGDSLAYTEGDGVVVIEQGGDATVSDIDSADFNGGTLTVSFAAGSDASHDLLQIRDQGTGTGQIGRNLADITYEGTVIGTFTGGTGGVDLVVTLNANATQAATQALLRNITFQNAGTEDPTEGARTIRFELTDGDGGSTGTHDATVTVTGVNDAPDIGNLAGDALAYTEDDGAVVIDQGTAATVTDPDSANLESGTLTVSIAAGGDTAEDVLAIQNQGTGAGQIGVSGSNITYEGTVIGTAAGGTGGADLVVTFNASATPEAVEALVQNVTYENTDTDMPSEGARTVRFTVTDGDGGTSTARDTTVTVTRANDAPAFAGLDATPGYTEGDAPVVLDADATVSDIELDAANGGNGDYDGATLTVERNGGANADDVFSFAAMANVTVVGSNLVKDGLIIATYTSTGGTLAITFTNGNGGTPTTAVVNEIVQAISYRNPSQDLPVGATEAVTLDFTLNDGTDSGTESLTLTHTGIDSNDVINGTPGDDSLSGGIGRDTMNGFAGDDTLRGDGGNDSIIGGTGADLLDGGTNDDTLLGGDGDDTLIGRNGNDHLQGDTGVDTATFVGATDITVDLRVTVGQDTGQGIDTLTGIENLTSGGGNDRLVGKADANRLAGNNGNDTLIGLGGNDLLFGGDGNDSLKGDYGADVLRGGNNNDTLEGGAGNDRLYGDDGTDKAVFAGAADITVDLRVTGAQNTGLGNDTLLDIENVASGTGDDQLTGHASANWIAGNAGNDILKGLGGNDTLLGGNDADKLYGGNGNDVLRGGGGNYTLTGDAGNDTIDGDAGVDMATFLGSNDITVDLRKTAAQDTGQGTDKLLQIENVTSGAGDDLLIGKLGANRLAANNGSDTLRGLGGDDTLFGGGGQDTLDGGTGRDILRGGLGNDLLIGAAGNDTLFGQGGGDTFRFNDGFGRDRIMDFVSGTDVIDLRPYAGLSSFSDLRIRENADGDAVVDLGTDEITVVGFAASDLDAGDFMI
ncbi:MAG: hypothetical protein C0606_13400 [Hyphomicrobiales bacterium]|nr:MAG: hypothetical protein C0606_13400 [Hyphomicrobiales bacterium]